MPGEVTESSSGMEETVQKDSKSGGQSPRCGTMRRAVATTVTFDGEATMDRRKKKKESRPESIIVYRSESDNKVEEEQVDEEGGERSSEEGSKFLGQSMTDGT